MKKVFQKINLRVFTNRGFNLTPVELKDNVPFVVKRVYFFSDLSAEAQTGEHCHYAEEEFFIQAKGQSVAIIDRGQGREEVPLGPSEAIYVPNYVWHGFKKASPDCLLIALSSTNYNPARSDYLENYDEYLQWRDLKLAAASA